MALLSLVILGICFNTYAGGPNPALFARSIYSCLEAIDDHKDRGQSCTPFLQAALDFSSNPDTRSRLNTILRELSFPLGRAPQDYMMMRLEQVQPELVAMLRGDRIKLRGLKNTNSEADLVEKLIKVALFGEYEDRVEMEIGGNRNLVLSLLLTYFADPRAKEYDPDVKHLLDITSKPPQKQPRGVSIPSRKASIRFTAEVMRFSETEARTLKTEFPPHSGDANGVNLIQYLEGLAKKVEKERIPFGPVVKRRAGTVFVAIEAYGVEWGWIIESYLRAGLGVARGNRFIWKIADKLRTTHSILSGAHFAPIEENAIAMAKRRNALKYFDGILDGLADMSQGSKRLNPGGQESVVSITTSAHGEIQQNVKQVLAAIRNRDPALLAIIEKDANKGEPNWFEKYLVSQESGKAEAVAEDDAAKRAFQQVEAKVKEIDSSMKDTRKSIETLSSQSERTLEESNRLTQLGKQLEAQQTKVETARKSANELKGAWQRTAKKVQDIEMLRVRLATALLIERGYGEVPKAVIDALNLKADSEPWIVIKVREGVRRIKGITLEEAERIDAALLEERQKKFAKRPQWQQRFHERRAARQALSKAEYARMQELFKELNYSQWQKFEYHLLKKLRLIVPGAQGMIYALSMGLVTYHFETGMAKLDRTDDPLRRMQILHEMGTDMGTDVAYMLPIIGELAVAADVVRFTLLSVPFTYYTIQGVFPWFNDWFGGRQLISYAVKQALRPTPQEEFQMFKSEIIRRINGEGDRDSLAAKNITPFQELDFFPDRKTWKEPKLLNLQSILATTQPHSKESVDQLAEAFFTYGSFLRQYAAKTLSLVFEVSSSANEVITNGEARKFEEELLDRWTGSNGYLRSMYATVEQVEKILDPEEKGKTVPINPYKIRVNPNILK